MARKRVRTAEMEQTSRIGMEIAQHFHEIIGTLLLSMPIPDSLSQMEEGVRDAMLRLGRTFLTSWLDLQNNPYPPETMSCRCGAQARYREMRDGVLVTALGRVTYRRAYYLCDACHQGTYPLDERLGLRPGEISADLERLTGFTGAQLPFAHSSELFEELTLLSVSPQTIDKATQAFGAEAEAVEKELIAVSHDPEALLRQERETAPIDRLYATLDAAKVHTDERRDADDEGWRDLKIGAWFESMTTAPATPDGDWDVKAKNIAYFCDIAPAERFGELLWATGVQRRAPRAKELIVVADGADWIWNLVETHFPKAVQIVDWFHAAEHLSAVTAACAPSPEAQAWLTETRVALWDGRLDDVIQACQRKAQPNCKNDAAHKALTYFTNNRQRMCYPEYRAKGYQIGSGTVESGCKQIGTQRMKVAGATWTTTGARHVAKARAASLSDGQWCMLAERRVHLAAPTPA